MRSEYKLSLCIAFLLTVAAAETGASGSGGGFGNNPMPSASAPQYDPAVEFQSGVEALKASRFKDAQRAFDRVLSVDSRHLQANFLAGYSRASQGNDKGARKFYEKAIRIDGEMVAARRELALSLIRMGKADEARAALDEMKKRVEACAGTCAQAAELDAAVSAVEAALAAPGANSEGGKTSSQALPDARLGDRSYLEAVALINEHRYEDAIARLQQASLAFGPHPDILTYLGFANRKLGRYDVAEDYYRRALTVAPRHLGATEYYGELMVERGDLAGAARMLGKLEDYCTFGCAEADELRRWIADAGHGS